VKALVPVIAYGNIELQATQEIDLANGNALDRSVETIAGAQKLKNDLAQVILPMVEAEVRRYASILLKEENPTWWLSKNSTVYTWFRIAYPDIEVPAMQNILDIQASNSVMSKAQE